jgi:hypothetical protein
MHRREARATGNQRYNAFMRRTTLVTLKARSQAFRMAMGVLHTDKADPIQKERCRRCNKLFEINPGDEPSFYCSSCAAYFKNATAYCANCGKLFPLLPSSLTICLKCYAAAPQVAARPRTRIHAFWMNIAYTLGIVLLLIAVLWVIENVP